MQWSPFWKIGKSVRPHSIATGILPFCLLCAWIDFHSTYSSLVQRAIYLYMGLSQWGLYFSISFPFWLASTFLVQRQSTLLSYTWLCARFDAAQSLSRSAPTETPDFSLFKTKIKGCKVAQFLLCCCIRRRPRYNAPINPSSSSWWTDEPMTYPSLLTNSIREGGKNLESGIYG